MSSVHDFARECGRVSMDLRRLPAAVRRDLAAQVKDEVAGPLAGKIAQAATGPWTYQLTAGVKARASADPQIVVGGLRPKLSGGGGPRSVIFGTEFGGGSNKRRVIQRSRKGNPYGRHSTNQFTNNHRPFVFATIAKNIDWVLDRYADIVLKTLNREVK